MFVTCFFILEISDEKQELTEMNLIHVSPSPQNKSLSSNSIDKGFVQFYVS